MYGCESWTVKKAEHWRTDAFELWCWRTLLRVPWTARRSNQSILKEISPGISGKTVDFILFYRYLEFSQMKDHWSVSSFLLDNSTFNKILYTFPHFIFLSRHKHLLYNNHTSLHKTVHSIPYIASPTLFYYGHV